MLELKNISKTYVTSSFTQSALDDVSLAFRDNEFVAILGPSGSGKTTMLNIIGGLDHFDAGDLVIDGISTREYRDRDWDTYRNNRIGFVFQSYNLIPHQTVLANVELALTLSGVSASERKERAREALARVGLADHVDKRPSQLSGGQMQRVAIARALINDPEILLADEPTGALDSKTSVQVMDLLKEVANDRLVIMVTHNPDLAHRYATRIVELADGRITGDSDPVDPGALGRREAKAARRTSMSFSTALALSFNNLMTKKGRTLMTAFAGSIGIIGIAAILALANGVNDYIRGVEEDTLSIYPLTIQSAGFDMTSMIAESMGSGSDEGADQTQATTKDVGESKRVSRMFSGVGRNDLEALKAYLDADGGGIGDHVNEIVYTYDATPQIFLPDTGSGVHQVNPENAFDSFGFNAGQSTVFSSAYSMTMFRQFPSSIGLFEGQYDMRAGRWPEHWNELVLVLSRDGTISDMIEYTLGLRDHAELEEMARALANGEEVGDTEGELSFTYEELMACGFKLVPASSFYEYESDYGVWTSRTDDAAYMGALVEQGEDLTIVGIVQPKEDVDATSLSSGIYYTPELVRHIIDTAATSEIVRDQQARPEVDVFTGKRFDDPEARSDFDMGTLITVDGDRISQAFRIDTGALAIDPSALDFSGIDLSGISVPPMDLSGLSLDLSGVQPLTPEQAAALFPELTPEDLAEVLGGVSITFKPGGEEALQQAFAEIGQGYAAWRTSHPEGTLEEYLDSAEVREQIVAAIAASLDTDAMAESLVSALAEKMDVPDVEGLTSEVAGRLLGAYQEQIASVLAAQLTVAISNYMQAAMASYMGQLSSAIQNQLEGAMGQLASNLSGAFSIDTAALESAFQFNMDENQLAALMSSLMSTEQTTLEGNLRKLGYADYGKPAEIDIYPIDFDHKQAVVDILDAYNERMGAEDEDKVISYTDIVGALMASVTRIIDMISAMLIAFVSISLVVSSIMIGVITYISVLERKKEIGILRSIGASKRDISNVFNAETVIEGLVAGLMGVGITLAISIPANAIVHESFGVARIAQLPWQAGFILVGISVLLNVIAGIIPARAASHSDPVEALRSE
ncbi:ATP-binding cassette domain-containing protein [Coriobacteriales bacterium OH1046]|nr:ATP-binding cassette domain-containing protein [Coriobacteriales bacterium OH1046]